MEIVVPSTTKYSDVWMPFCHLFKKFWQDCPYPVRLITDTKTDEWGFEDPIVIGQDLGWCTNFRKGLDQVDAEFVLMIQDDFLFNAPVDHAFVNKALKMMLDDDSIGCFRLYPCPGPDIQLGPDYGQIDSNAKYRVSCQSAIWRVKHLKEILARFNTPREFEIDGTNYVNNNCNNVKYYSVKREPNQWPLQYYCSAITRGEWNPDAVNFVKSLNIPINNSRRPTLPY